MSDSHSIEFWPNPGTEVRQLFVLLHGVGGTPDGLESLALALRVAFPGAVVRIPEGFEPHDAGGRQWFPVHDITEANRPQRVAQALPALAEYVQSAQHSLRLKAADTALVGFSQGAIMALEAVQAYGRLAGRVLAFAGRYAQLPTAAPPYTTIHLLHGADDAVMPVSHAQAAQARLAELHGDSTIDVASRVGHELHPALVQRAIQRLQTCVPLRSWAAAMTMDPAPPAGTMLH
ncbi:esterase [Bordetella sp. 2513F-2]